jgi:hypothetical protein
MNIGLHPGCTELGVTVEFVCSVMTMTVAAVLLLLLLLQLLQLTPPSHRSRIVLSYDPKSHTTN